MSQLYHTNIPAITLGQQLVHRDVFASTKDKVVAASTNLDGSKMGDAFGLKGTYDLFPENSGDYDVRQLHRRCL